MLGLGLIRDRIAAFAEHHPRSSRATTFFRVTP
jgi:hypothetical protein